MLVQPLFGALSIKLADVLQCCVLARWPRIFTVPILTALQKRDVSVYGVCLVIVCFADCEFLYVSISGILKAEMFPAQVRALGVGLSYAVANALFGGSAEYVALSLKSVGMETTFFWYVTALAIVAFWYR